MIPFLHHTHIPGADLNHPQVVINLTTPDRAGYSNTQFTGGSRLMDLPQTFLLMLIRTAVAERKQIHPCTVRYMFRSTLLSLH